MCVCFLCCVNNIGLIWWCFFVLNKSGGLMPGWVLSSDWDSTDEDSERRTPTSVTNTRKIRSSPAGLPMPCMVSSVAQVALSCWPRCLLTLVFCFLSPPVVEFVWRSPLRSAWPWRSSLIGPRPGTRSESLCLIKAGSVCSVCLPLISLH